MSAPVSSQGWGLAPGRETYAANARAGRHGWSADFATAIEQIIQARAAADLLERLGDLEDLAEDQVLAVLPVWAWMTSRIPMGRKSHSAERELTFPVRIVWNVPVVHVGRQGTPISYSVEGLGNRLTGQILLGDEGFPSDLSVAASWTFGSSVLRAPLTLLADREPMSRWEVMEMLQTMIVGEVEKAHAMIWEDFGAPILDPISREQIADTLLLGTEEKSSAAARFIEKSITKTDAFAKVDPLRAARVEMYRCARQEIQLAMGDPRVGPKVRAIADDFRDTSGRLDLEGLIAAYQALHPRDRLGRDRAIAALTAGPDIMADAVRGDDVLELVSAA